MEDETKAWVLPMPAVAGSGPRNSVTRWFSRRRALRLCRAALRLIVVVAFVTAAGWWIQQKPRPTRTRILGFRGIPHAPLCILAGFLSVTLLAGIRLSSQRLRAGLACRPRSIVLLCLALLGLQGFETFSHDGSLWYEAGKVLPRCKRSPPVRYAVASSLRYVNRLGEGYVENPTARIAVLGVACLLISLLWGARAWEAAFGSAQFWIWTFAYVFIEKARPGWWRVQWDFWGQWVPPC